MSDLNEEMTIHPTTQYRGTENGTIMLTVAEVLDELGDLDHYRYKYWADENFDPTEYAFHNSGMATARLKLGWRFDITHVYSNRFDASERPGVVVWEQI